MARSLYKLAALSTAAVPGLEPVRAQLTEHDDRADYDIALIQDSRGGRWVVRSPRRTVAGANLESEVQLLESLRQASLPFATPEPAGFAELPEGGRCMVYPLVAGDPIDLDRIEPGPGLGAQLGRALAAIHEIPPLMIESVGFPVYSCDDIRRRHLAQLDQAAQSGKVPTALMQRWERMLEDISLWRFRPCVVHDDLAEEHLLTTDGTVTGVLNWGQASVGDPASDLAWLINILGPAEMDSVFEGYVMRRAEQPDDNLLHRAQLVGELALMRWLLHGIHTQDAEVVSDAEAMLWELNEELAEAARLEAEDDFDAAEAEAASIAEHSAPPRHDSEESAAGRESDASGRRAGPD